MPRWNGRTILTAPPRRRKRTGPRSRVRRRRSLLLLAWVGWFRGVPGTRCQPGWRVVEGGNVVDDDAGAPHLDDADRAAGGDGGAVDALGPPLLPVDPHQPELVDAGLDLVKHEGRLADEPLGADALGRLVAVEPPGDRPQARAGTPIDTRMNASHSSPTGTPAKARRAAITAPRAKGRRKNEPAAVSSPSPNTTAAPSQIHRQISGDSIGWFASSCSGCRVSPKSSGVPAPDGRLSGVRADSVCLRYAPKRRAARAPQRPRPPRRRGVEGRGHGGPVPRRGRALRARVLHRRRGGRHPQPGHGAARGARPPAPRSGWTSSTGRPRSSATTEVVMLGYRDSGMPDTPANARSRQLRPGRPRRGDRPAGGGDPRGAAAGDRHLRRRPGVLPPPRPPQGARHQRRRLRCRRRPRRVTPTPATRGSRSSCTTRCGREARMRGPARGLPGERARVAVRREVVRARRGPTIASPRSITVRDFYDVRRRALLAHATQIDPESPFWFGLPARGGGRDPPLRRLPPGPQPGRRGAARRTTCSPACGDRRIIRTHPDRP